jgi:hypothetical protein
MVIHPVVTNVIQSTLIPAVPILAQFASTVGAKCVAFGFPCVIGASLSAHSSTGGTAAGRIGALATLRGGANNLVDLERVELRLNSMEEYCVIASIIMGAVIGMYLGWNFWLDLGRGVI